MLRFKALLIAAPVAAGLLAAPAAHAEWRGHGGGGWQVAMAAAVAAGMARWRLPRMRGPGVGRRVAGPGCGRCDRWRDCLTGLRASAAGLLRAASSVLCPAAGVLRRRRRLITPRRLFIIRRRTEDLLRRRRVPAMGCSARPVIRGRGHWRPVGDLRVIRFTGACSDATSRTAPRAALVAIARIGAQGAVETCRCRGFRGLPGGIAFGLHRGPARPPAPLPAPPGSGCGRGYRSR